MKSAIKILSLALIVSAIIFHPMQTEAQDTKTKKGNEKKGDMKNKMSDSKMYAAKMSNMNDVLKPSGKYNNDKQVFIKSVLAMDYTDKTAKSATFPLLQGWTAKGEKTYYIITESSDYEDAKKFAELSLAPPGLVIKPLAASCLIVFASVWAKFSPFATTSALHSPMFKSHNGVYNSLRRLSVNVGKLPNTL